MDKIWNDLYNEALKALNPRNVSKFVEAGGVAAAIESESGKIYVGVCVDSACTLGICAERNAIFNMITNGENRFKKVIAIDSKGKAIPPCGACREFMAQINGEAYKDVIVMLDYKNNIVKALKELTPDWWI